MDLIAMLARCEPAREIIVYLLGDLWGASNLRATCRASRAMIRAPDKISPDNLRLLGGVPLLDYLIWWGKESVHLLQSAIDAKSPEKVCALSNRSKYLWSIARDICEYTAKCGDLPTYHTVLGLFGSHINCSDYIGHIEIAAAEGHIDLCRYVLDLTYTWYGQMWRETQVTIVKRAFGIGIYAGHSELCRMIIREFPILDFNELIRFINATAKEHEAIYGVYRKKK